MRVIVSAAALAAFAACGGVAGAARVTPDAYAACMSKANSTMEMQQCQATAVDSLNARLTTAYAKALAALPPDQQTKLRAAQRLWLAFRSSDCQVFYGAQSGTIATVQGGACMIDRTRERIKNLADFLPLGH